MFEAHFQTFEDSTERAASAARITALRAELRRRRLDGFIVPRADRHQGEYVPASDARLAWLTGFTGSAGAAIVLADRAVIFVDGRYVLQVRDQIDTNVFAVEHLVDNPPEKWLEANLAAGARFAYDPWLHSADHAERFSKAAAAAGATLVPVESNPLDAVWTDRPAPPLGPVTVRELKFAGETSADKLARIRPEIAQLKADTLIVSDAHNVAWTFNIRGSDVEHTPLPLAFASIPREGRPSIYIDGRKLSNETRDYLETLADVREPAAFDGDLKALGAAKATVRVDSSTGADAISRLVSEAGGSVMRGADPITLMKAVKNATEIAGTRAAHVRDGAAVSNFLAWFDREAPGGKLTEIDAVAALESFRRDTGLLKDVSFPTISGRRAERRDRALPRDARHQPQYREQRAVPGRLRRAIRGRHHRHHPHDSRSVRRRPRCASASPACSRATSRSPARCFPTASPARSSIRSRASTCGTPASTSIMAPGTASAAICRCTKVRRAFPSAAPRSRSSAA